MDAPKHTNSLARQKSPYLLQHAHNPVDWFAWGQEAFDRAHAADRPIFLSIGYSTCHWCHVMERESFEDETIAAFLREHFVSIKVDREERPDVDKIYMTFVQSTVGGGGWPLNVFLTPDLKPFFGGTYFPPDNRHGRPGFLHLLQQIAQIWRERRLELAANADELHARLELVTTREPGPDSPLTPEILRHALAAFKQAYDPVHGGFGGAPKFPQPAVPAFVLRAAQRFDDPAATAMVLATCERMAAGGIHDQLGGGFSRYSVDAEWLVPHFEKMLYDNAQLAHLYLDAHLIERAQSAPPKLPANGSPFSAVARDILDYVLAELTHPEGGFYSAEDADSEGHEGKFYCWTHDELAALLAPDEFIVATRFFGITKNGNFLDHSHPKPLPGQNVLWVADAKVPPLDLPLLTSAIAKMRAVRARRIRPHLDDKVLASWNGLMLGAFARAAVVLNDDRYLAAARKNLEFIRQKLWLPGSGSGSGTGTLFHRWRDGERDDVQLLEGYAFLLDGVIHLYEATLEAGYLEFASALADAMLAKFHDPANGGFWQSPREAGDLILRVKDDYDGAEPSGNSVATLALFKLAAITGREDFRIAAEATLSWSAPRLRDLPAALAYMLHALDFSLSEPSRVVIAGDPEAAPTRALIRAAHSIYQPHKVVLGARGPVEPFARTLDRTGETAAYVCVGTACQLPTADPAKIRELLRAESTSGSKPGSPSR
jgi:uncharacterized protein YyaL (SSP411 family)